VDATPEGFEQMMAVNVRAPLFMIQRPPRSCAARVCGFDRQHRLDQRPRRQPFILSYCVSKGALETMTATLLTR
jgi:NAD(P)-dependent dehydrogenase (short-subunit alcohol dehydrogenase family)